MLMVVHAMESFIRLSFENKTNDPWKVFAFSKMSPLIDKQRKGVTHLQIIFDNNFATSLLLRCRLHYTCLTCQQHVYLPLLHPQAKT